MKYTLIKRFYHPPFGGWGGFLLLFLLPSCVETLDIDNKDIKPKIVLNGIIEADSTITVKISKTYAYTNDFYNIENYSKDVSPEDRRIPNLLPHANPKLYINDEPMGNLRFVKNDSTRWDNGSIFQSGYRPKIGDRVRIEVTAQGFESVWAETIIPQPILIHQVDTSTYIFKNNFGYRDRNVIPDEAKSLNLNMGIGIENPDRKNQGFYTIRIYQEWFRYINQYWVEGYGWVYKERADSVSENRELIINTSKEPLLFKRVEDELLQFFLEKGNAQSLYYFSDKSFSDKRYKLNISVWGYYFHGEYNNPAYEPKPKMHNDPLNIEITSLSPELYQLFYTDYSEMDFYIHLLSEPKVTFSNVHNGAGILGSLSKTKRVIEIPEYSGEY